MTKQTRTERWDEWGKTLEEIDLLVPGADSLGLQVHNELQQLRQHADAMREALEAAVIDIDAKPKGEFDDYLIVGLKQSIESYDKFLREEVE